MQSVYKLLQKYFLLKWSELSYHYLLLIWAAFWMLYVTNLDHLMPSALCISLIEILRKKESNYISDANTENSLSESLGKTQAPLQ